MKNKTIGLLALTTVLFLTACGTENAKIESKEIKSTPSEQPQTKQQVTPPEEKSDAQLESYKELLPGRWQDMQDHKSEVVFQDDLMIDYYDGAEVDRGPFTFEKTCPGAVAEGNADYIVQGDLCWEIASLDEGILSFIYIGRGNAIFYSRVDENTKQADSVTNDVKLAIIKAPVKSSQVTSPVTVTGKAPAFWFFENSFPVQVQDGAGQVLGYGQAYPDYEALTEGMNAFHADFEFDKSTTATGTLHLEASNASGLPENAHSVDLPISF